MTTTAQPTTLNFTVPAPNYTTMIVTIGLDDGNDVSFTRPYDEQTYDEYSARVGSQRVTYSEARDGKPSGTRPGVLSSVERF